MKIPKNKWIDPKKIKIPYGTLLIAFMKNPAFGEGCQFTPTDCVISVISRQSMDICKDLLSFYSFPITNIYRWKPFPEAPKEMEDREFYLEKEICLNNPHPLHLFLDQIEVDPYHYLDKIYEASCKAQYKTTCGHLSELIRGSSEIFRFLGESWGSYEGWKKRYQKYWDKIKW